MFKPSNKKLVFALVAFIMVFVQYTHSSMFETIVGRLVLMSLVLGLLRYSPEIGLVFTLVSGILMVSRSQRNDWFAEGFTDASKNELKQSIQTAQGSSASASTEPTTTDTSSPSSSPSSSSPTTTDILAAVKQQLQNKRQQEMATTSTSSSTTESFRGKEGFNLIEYENQMLRGKNSSQLKVGASSREQSDSVEASEPSIFSTSFAGF
jgi:hypothetical protein